jgi:hypothetical protein
VSDTELSERRGRVDTTISDHDETLDEYGDRLTDLERFKEQVKGALLVLSIIASSGLATAVLNLLGVF